MPLRDPRITKRLSTRFLWLSLHEDCASYEAENCRRGLVNPVVRNAEESRNSRRFGDFPAVSRSKAWPSMSSHPNRDH